MMICPWLKNILDLQKAAHREKNKIAKMKYCTSLDTDCPWEMHGTVRYTVPEHWEKIVLLSRSLWHTPFLSYFDLLESQVN